MHGELVNLKSPKRDNLYPKSDIITDKSSLNSLLICQFRFLMKSSDGTSGLDFSANIFVCGTKLENCELIWMKILVLMIKMSQKLVVAINQICSS